MRFTRLHLAALSLGLAIVGTTVLSNSADAQRGQAGGGQGRGQGGGWMGGMGGMFGNNDPLQSNANQLLQREDVQGELGISGAQREKMQAAQQQGMQNMRQKMQSGGFDREAMRNATPEQRQEMVQKMQTLRQEISKSMAADQQKQMDEVLNASQRKRLAELDLKFRGPLALGEEAVGKKLNLTPDQQREIGNILTEYRTGQQEAMQAMRPNRGGGGNDGGGQPGQFDPAAMQTRIEEGRKAMDRVKKGSSDKIVALLTDSQKAAWKAAQGKPFAFKTITPQFGRPGGNRS